MRIDAISRAWGALLLLSMVSVVLAAGAAQALPAGAAGVLILVFAWMKARLILSRYLGLWRAPFWLSGFNWALGLFSLLLLVLYLVPVIRAQV